MTHMPRAIFVVFLALLIFDLFFIGLLGLMEPHRYQWMSDIDPTMTQLPEDRSSPFRHQVASASLAILLIVHVLVVRYLPSTRQRIFSGVGAFIAVVVYVVRWV